jgi:asparagine synthase (glutamine-hydrolysing)
VESPLCGPEQFYKYELHRFARATRPDLKVMLLGQASDEFNGGYTVWIADGGDWAAFADGVRNQARATALLAHPRLVSWWQREFPLLRDDVLRATAAEALDDPYAAYVAWKYRDIQQYNNWHEDRTAAGNGVEARVPFLDHRIVELTATVPKADRRRFLWDKQILRDALDGVLPPELVVRPKAPFYYGSGVRHVFRSFASMLARDDDALLDMALSSGRARELIDLDGARATLRGLEAQPSADVELLLRLVNLGLLEQMLADLPSPPVEWPAQPLPREVEVTDWELDGAAIRAEVLPARPLPLDAVPQLADGVLLVRAEPEDGTWFLVVDGSLEYVIDEDEDADWLRFLRAVDGTRELGEILADTGAELEALQGLLDEALDVGVLELAVPALRPVGS